MTAQAGSDTDFPNGEYSEFVDRPVTKSVAAGAADTEKILDMNVSTVATENSELEQLYQVKPMSGAYLYTVYNVLLRVGIWKRYQLAHSNT